MSTVEPGLVVPPQQTGISVVSSQPAAGPVSVPPEGSRAGGEPLGCLGGFELNTARFFPFTPKRARGTYKVTA
jgi:hypothetical protein